MPFTYLYFERHFGGDAEGRLAAYRRHIYRAACRKAFMIKYVSAHFSMVSRFCATAAASYSVLTAQ